MGANIPDFNHDQNELTTLIRNLAFEAPTLFQKLQEKLLT